MTKTKTMTMTGKIRYMPPPLNFFPQKSKQFCH
jgi:hypothetical protein